MSTSWRARPWRIAGRLAFGLIALAIAAYSLFPFYWTIVSSLKEGSDLYRVEFLPRSPTIANYTAVFAEQPFARNILNSVVVAGGAVAIALALAVPASYALGRIEFRGRRTLLIGVLGVSMFPQVAILSGLFELVRWLGLYDRLGALIVSYLVFTLPFTVWILTTYMRELPRELEEAALLDGATPFDLLVRVLLPLLAPAAAATGLLAFIVAWNEFLFALTFTLSNETRTVPVAIALISGASQYELPWGRVMAASVIVTLPIIVLTLVLQRRIVAGLTAGAVRG
jgi:trehalose/maltose transport system permease protein